jgi:hypothetical protein
MYLCLKSTITFHGVPKINAYPKVEASGAYFENAPLLRALIYVEHAKKILMIPIDPLSIIG